MRTVDKALKVKADTMRRVCELGLMAWPPTTPLGPNWAYYHRRCYACGYIVPENEFYIDHWRTNCVNTLLKTAVVLAWQGGP